MSDIPAAVPPVELTLQEPDAGSFPKRVVDTFFSPIALFSRFGARPPWVDVMLVSVVIGVLAMTLVPTEVWVNTTEEALRRSGRPAPQGMDPESMAGMQRMFSMVGGAIVPWIFLVIQSGVLLLIFTVVLGGRASFRQYLALGAHAALIGAVGQLAAIPVAVQTGIMAPMGISLGALAGGMDADSFLYQFLNLLGVFLLWQLVVMGLGVAALNRKIGAGTAVSILLGIYGCIAALIAWL